MLLELERECLEVYRRKVDEASNAKARLHQSVAAKEAELATLMASLGELNIHSPVKDPLELMYFLKYHWNDFVIASLVHPILSLLFGYFFLFPSFCNLGLCLFFFEYALTSICIISLQHSNGLV